MKKEKGRNGDAERLDRKKVLFTFREIRTMNFKSILTGYDMGQVCKYFCLFLFTHVDMQYYPNVRVKRLPVLIWFGNTA